MRNPKGNIVDLSNGRETEVVGSGQLDLGLDLPGRVLGIEEIENIRLIIVIGKINVFIGGRMILNIGDGLIKAGIPGEGIALLLVNKITIKIIDIEIQPDG